MHLPNYKLIIINSSAGKDSLVAIHEVCRLAEEQGYPKEQIIVSHQDLGEMEWEGTIELVKEQADFFGLRLITSKRRDFKGYEETLLEYVLRRGKWPARNQRYCTSDFKTGPGGRVVIAVTKEFGKCSILYVFGFRKEESPARASKKIFSINKKWTTQKRRVYDWLPIHTMTSREVWKIIKDNKLPYHFAYDLGMPRLSCVFCIFSPFDALVLAGKANPELLDRYIEVEKKIGHTFRNEFSIAEVKTAIQNNYEPKNIQNWIM